MKFDRAGSIAVFSLVLLIAVPLLAWAGGVGFSDEDINNEDEGPSFFGFVREVDGPGIPDAKVTAELKDRGALVTRTDILGVYKIPGFGKDINPNDIMISCAKDGYTQANVVRRPPTGPTDPIEVECYLKKN